MIKTNTNIMNNTLSTSIELVANQTLLNLSKSSMDLTVGALDYMIDESISIHNISFTSEAAYIQFKGHAKRKVSIINPTVYSSIYPAYTYR